MSRSRDWARSQSLDRFSRPSCRAWCSPVGLSVRAPHRLQTAIRPFVSGAWWSSSCAATCRASEEVMVLLGVHHPFVGSETVIPARRRACCPLATLRPGGSCDHVARFAGTGRSSVPSRMAAVVELYREGDESIRPGHRPQLRAGAAPDGGSALRLPCRPLGRGICGPTRPRPVRRHTGGFTARPPGSLATTRCSPLTTTSAPSSRRGHRHGPTTRTRTRSEPGVHQGRTSRLRRLLPRPVRGTLDALTDQRAAWPLPDTHRNDDLPYGVVVGGIPLHVVEHAAQIRQFLTAAGVSVRPMPGDRGFEVDR